MKYKKNTNLEFLDIDDENLAIYDPDSGDTHYIDSTGKAILSLLDEETEESALVAELCKMYSADKAEIESDVHEFFAELAEKNVVIQL